MQGLTRDDLNDIIRRCANKVLLADAEDALDRLLNVEHDEPDLAAYADWGDTQVSSTAGLRRRGEGGLDNSGTADSSTSATLRDTGDAVSDPGDVAPIMNPSAEADPIGLQDNPVGGAADAQHNLMKRAYPGEVDGDDGNGKRNHGRQSRTRLTETDVKRRRS